MKTSIKKTIAFALTLCAISAGTIAPNAGKFSLSPTPIVSEAATQIGDFTFTRKSTNSASITSYIGSSTSPTLPTTVKIDGVMCNVTSIDEYAFSRNNKVKSLTIPEGYCSIGKNSFEFCSNLNTVNLPSSLNVINANAFMFSGITNISIPSNVKRIDGGAFSNCSNLKTVKINSTLLNNLSPSLFNSCTSLTSINVPSSIKTINEYCFSGCTALLSITISSGVTTIKHHAFADCTKLTSISLPSSVTEFGQNAFYNTPWLKNHAKTNLLVIHNNIVIDGSSAVRNVSIPSNVKGIADSAFANNRAIQQVTMPSSVTAIGTSAFKGCTNLATVTLSKNLKAIPDSCFNGCKYLRTINFPDNIETIGLSAFLNCSDLRTFRFPNKLKTIGNAAFENCKMLGEISNVNTSTNYSIDGLAFEKCLNLKKINGKTVVSCSGYNVSLYQADFVKKYFSKTDNVGFIQDFVDKKAQAVVDQIKAKYPKYNYVQIARELENWMCKNGCSAKENWKKENKDTNYPSDLEYWDEYHRESSVLMNGVGVCEGWAKGYNLLLQKAGIWAEIVSSDGHAWNVIYEDGKWFNVDSYWDDAGSNSEFKWFMVSDNEASILDNKGSHVKRYIKRKDNDYYQQEDIIPCTTPMGDVNIDGKLDSTDVSWLDYYVKNKKDPDKWFNHVCADMNFDGQINSKDLSLLKTKVSNQKKA